jgi:hypothetical protein
MILFTPVVMFWQLLNRFLLSPWGLLVPMALILALVAVLQLQQTPAQLAAFYAGKLNDSNEEELALLLEVLVRIGDDGVAGLVSGLTSKQENVFNAVLHVLQNEFGHWDQSDRREHHYRVFSEALLQKSEEFSPAAQAEVLRFVDRLLQLRNSSRSAETMPDRQKTIANCERILIQLGHSRRKMIDPGMPNFAPAAETVAGLNKRMKQPVLLASNGQPFVPASARKETKQDETLLADRASFDSFSVVRADRLHSYQKSLQNVPDQTLRQPVLPDIQGVPELLAEVPPLGLTAEVNPQVADNYTANRLRQAVTSPADIAEEYRNKKSGGQKDPPEKDHFLTPELRNVPLDRVPNLPAIQLMMLLHHPDPPYIESARKTLMGRDGFQEQHLKLAWRLYHPVPSIREEIIGMLPNTPSVQPSVWLAVLLNDPSGDVRYRAASFMATAGDPALQRLLAERGKRDNDERIVKLADRINDQQRGTVRR